jgi:hypothetical protein
MRHVNTISSRNLRIVGVSIVLATITLGCRESATVSVEQRIMNHYTDTGKQVKSVTLVEKPQVYEDSFRSPNDVGTMTKGKARVEFLSGKTEEHEFEVFVAKSDGWTNIYIRGDRQ